ncbi:MAG: glycosyltransferase family 2 protein [Ottowia sp.]|nr:glycosyltransferase family 2 protein [Ottowia sp.]
MRQGRFSLSCIVPVYNEAKHLAEFLAALHTKISAITTQHEILVINDGSRDNTREVVQSLTKTYGMRYLELSRNFGKEAALTAGIDHARGDAVLLIDADFQHPLTLIDDMVSQWQHGYDMVYGVIADRSAESNAKRLGTHLFYTLLNRSTKTHIPAHAGDFRLMDRKVIQAMRALPERNRFMKGLYAWVGFKSVALPFVPLDRIGGHSRFNWQALSDLAISGITAFTTLPLRIWSVVGTLISLLAIAYGLYIALDAFFFGNAVAGWATLSAGLMLFSGVQLLSIGILGEYLGRVYDEVKQRPIYLLACDTDDSPLNKE